MDFVPSVLLVEPDAALASLLKTRLEAARFGVPTVATDAKGLAPLLQVLPPILAGQSADPADVEGARGQALQRAEKARVKLTEARCLLSGSLGPATVVRAVVRDAETLARLGDGSRMGPMLP